MWMYEVTISIKHLIISQIVEVSYVCDRVPKNKKMPFLKHETKKGFSKNMENLGLRLYIIAYC